MGKVALLVLALLAIALPAVTAGTFEIENDQFIRDGKPFQVMAGCIHYSRVVPEYWKDRLTRLRAMGLNAIQTYVPWNFHNQDPDVYDFEGNADIVTFLKTAQEVGLLVLLRAGPYMCGEWEFGGLPAWLLGKQPPVTIRTYEQGYIDEVDKWWNVLLPKIKPLLYSNGGPVVMMQVENEFGSYGNVANPLDKQYMEHLVSIARAHLGNDLILYTTDGGSEGYMSKGTLPGDIVFSVGDFGPGSNPETAFAAQKKYNAPGKSVNMCSEFYSGWLTHWGEQQANTSSTGFAAALDHLLSLNASVSMYMGHGGSNFGYWSGANGGGGTSYLAHITSYDYDSPVSEGGEHGYGSDGKDKYELTQKVLLKYNPDSPPEPPINQAVKIEAVTLTESIGFWDALEALTNKTVTANQTLTQEALHQNYGFTLYSTLTNASKAWNLTLPGAQDRAHVFQSSGNTHTFLGISYRTSPSVVKVPATTGPTSLDILVENTARINYGHGMYDFKGIVGGKIYKNNVSIDNQDWTMKTLPIPSTTVQNLKFQTGIKVAAPGFLRGFFNLASVADTYVYTSGWHKGIVWINGFNLGRYWEDAGPQHTLYVPAHILTIGVNNIIIFELDKVEEGTIQFQDRPLFGKEPCSAANDADTHDPVLMYQTSSKFQANQQWEMNNTTGLIRLMSNKDLCLASVTWAQVTLGACDPSNSAMKFTMSGSALKNNNLCLDVFGHGTEDGTVLDTYTCNGGSNQQWNFVDGMLVSAQKSASGGKFVATVCGRY